MSASSTCDACLLGCSKTGVSTAHPNPTPNPSPNFCLQLHGYASSNCSGGFTFGKPMDRTELPEPATQVNTVFAPTGDAEALTVASMRGRTKISGRSTRIGAIAPRTELQLYGAYVCTKHLCILPRLFVHKPVALADDDVAQYWCSKNNALHDGFGTHWIWPTEGYERTPTWTGRQ